MFVRVVRFSDVSAERVEGLRTRIEESDGPPPGVPATGLKVLYDGEQGTAVVLQYFATAEDMDAGAKAFGYPSFWGNRANLPVEALGAAPDAIGSGMADLVAFVMG